MLNRVTSNFLERVSHRVIWLFYNSPIDSFLPKIKIRRQLVVKGIP